MLPRFSCVVALIIGLGVDGISAQSLKRSTGPTELPPASFQGKQYVDSGGCAFIRAGHSGRVTWVPRVSRSRKVLCGFQPTFLPSQATKARPENKQRRVVKRQAPAVQKVTPKAQAGRLFRSTPAAVINPNSRIAPRVKPVDKLIAPCVGASSLSARYINQNAEVRCGPQNASPRTVIRKGGVQQGSLGGELRGPKGVNRRIAQQKTIKAPNGYRAAHSDDRLNPLRGVGTLSGKTQMAMIWSNTVPRYLIDPNTGKRLR